MVQRLPSFFFFSLFWKQYLAQALKMSTNTHIARELFTLINKMLLETNISNQLSLIQPEEKFVTDLVKMIRDRPIYEVGSQT